MTIELPPYKFDSSLKEDPVDTVQWNSFIHDLLEQLKSSKRMEIYESLGMALRVARRFDEAELYLSKAFALSESPSKKIQNLVRLAHVYQWENEFSKAEALFDQAKSLINEFEISNSLRAAYHQHLGKLYFDQSFMGLAVTEFELALKIRKSNDNQQDQVDSTLLALNESKRLWADKNDQVVIRRAEPSDAEAVHLAHMKSINEICKSDHTPEEIRVWGGRTFKPEFRLPGIQSQFYLVAEYNGKIEGFCQLQTRFKGSQKSAHLYGFYVTPEILKKRVGHTFMQLLFDHCKSQKIHLITLKSSITAFGFYQKYGFHQTGEMSGSLIDGVMIRGTPMEKVFYV
jgi:tetratricopeptide (TPR) repeat protein